ncbi:hypothetical protein [Isoptericola sp. NPDC055881]
MTGTPDLFEGIEPKPSDRAITADLMTRLRRHYIKPGAPLPGGVFLPEVGWNGGTHPTRCDALYVGFTGTSGRMLVGHEVKASRSDWLNELNKPGKADAWADQCHEWWLVTVPGVVQEGELPDGWGLMVPGRSKTRMQVVTAARRHADRTPSWAATRSIIARQDTLRADAIRDEVEAARQKIYAANDEHIQAAVARRLQVVPDVAALQAELDLIHQALGVGQVVTTHSDDGYEQQSWAGERATDLDLADVAALLRDHADLAGARRALAGRYALHEFDVLRRVVKEIERVRDGILAATATPKEVPA